MLESQSKNPEDYGWKKSVNVNFEPVPRLDPIAPQNILKVISCGCKAEKTDAVLNAVAKKLV